MLPDHVLSTEPIFGYFLPPKDEDPNPLVSKDWGGVALNDTSEGLQYQIWTATITAGVNFVSKIHLTAPNQEPILIHTGNDLQDISLTFDQNMNPAYSYTEAGIAKFRWYDSQIQNYTTTVLPAGSASPRCVLDDKRQAALPVSDILLFYTRAGNLYFREQRDRYGVEYLLASGVSGDVIMAGMSTVFRIQLALGLMDMPVLQSIYRSTVNGRRRVTTQGDDRRVVGGSYG